MNNLHKILIGANAGLWLPFALTRLRELARQYGDGPFIQKYRLPGFEIEVEQSRIAQYVRVTAVDGMYFEFASSAWPLVQASSTQEGITFQGYKGVIVGVNVGVGLNTLTTTSSVRGQKRTTNGADVSAIARPYQAQLVNEPVAYPPPPPIPGSTKPIVYKTALMESWAPGNPHTGIGLRGTENVGGLPNWLHAGPITQHIERDVGFDVPFAKAEGRTAEQRAYIRDTADWPRANGLQQVHDDTYGDREFAIYVDTFNQFYVFPTAAIEAVNGILQNVDTPYIRRATPAFPGWCFVPTTKFKDAYAAGAEDFANHNAIDQPELDWKFRHDGKRAATIAYERSSFVNDTAYWAIDPHATHPFTQGYFDQVNAAMGVQGRFDQLHYFPDHNPTHYFAAPGIVEATISIVLTGHRLDQFEIEVTIAEKRRPATSNYCALAVGYVWHDIPVEPAAPDSYRALKGDFLAIDIERYSPKTGSRGTWTFLPSNLAEVLSVKQLDDNLEIMCLVARPLLAIDLTTLSFVTQAFPLNGGSDPNYRGAAVVTRGYLREILLPQTACSDADKASMREWAEKDGRAWINAFIADDARWEYVPLNPAGGDGWSNPGALAFREKFARVAEPYRFTIAGSPPPLYGPAPYDVYKTGAAPSGASVDSGEEDIYCRWGQYPGAQSAVHGLFCTNPRWGWNCYASLINRYVWTSPQVTFYTHPNGTWAYWSNDTTHIPSSMIGSLAAFDATRVEHVILDRVHFERRVKNGTSYQTLTKDTTFFALYNAAVNNGRSAETLEAGIENVTQANLRASFTKSFIFAPPSTFYLDLAAQWDGGLWFAPEPGVYDGPAPSDALRRGRTRGLGFEQLWYTGAYYAGFTNAQAIPAVATPHARFANPILVGA